VRGAQSDKARSKMEKSRLHSTMSMTHPGHDKVDYSEIELLRKDLTKYNSTVHRPPLSTDTAVWRRYVSNSEEFDRYMNRLNRMSVL
jgi:hypothetical protein